MAEVMMRQVHKWFGDTHVIKGVDLDIKDNDFTVFVGPSGCGKSTLLRLIAGLEEISDGELLIDGKLVNDVPPSRRGIAMVFQSYALYPHMTVYDNMAFALKLAKESKKNIEACVGKVARILKIEHLLKRKPAELSGGERQRVAIGRSIVREPKVFLFDEPLSNLDAALRMQMRIELAKLKSDLNTTMIYVTHDQVEAMTLANKIVVLSAGCVEQVGAPLKLYHYPCNRFVAGFIGSPSMNFLDTEVTALTETSATVVLPGGGRIAVPVKPDHMKAGETVTLGIRPEHMHENGTGDSQLVGVVLVAERMGSETHLYVCLEGDKQVTVTAAGDSPARIGDQIRIGILAEACHLFDKDGNVFERLGKHRLFHSVCAVHAH